MLPAWDISPSTLKDCSDGPSITCNNFMEALNFFAKMTEVANALLAS